MLHAYNMPCNIRYDIPGILDKYYVPFQKLKKLNCRNINQHDLFDVLMSQFDLENSVYRAHPIGNFKVYYSSQQICPMRSWTEKF